VPLKDGRKLKLRAVNWPKGFYVKGLPPEGIRGAGKVQLLTLLSQHNVPRTAEAKYFNTIAFFDCLHRAQEFAKFESAVPSQPASEADLA
jgi:hypothetical protein